MPLLKHRLGFQTQQNQNKYLLGLKTHSRQAKDLKVVFNLLKNEINEKQKHLNFFSGSLPNFIG